MKRRLSLVLLAVVLSCGTARKSGVDVEFLRPPPPKTRTLANGIEILYLEDRELPTMEVFLYLRGGTVSDPARKEGLASLAMSALRLGGTSTRLPDRIEEDLEYEGAAIEFAAQDEALSVSLALLRKDLSDGLDILFDLLRRPAVDPSRLELVRGQMAEALRRESESPEALAARAYAKLVYGPGQPRGSRPTLETVAAITREDILNFHKKFFHPDRIILAAAGDMEFEDFAKEIEERAADWKRSVEPLPRVPEVKKSFEPAVGILSKDDLTQSTIVLGHLGEKRTNPDKFKILVMNFILGGSGSLTSRMGSEIRSVHGKAYVVWSQYGFGDDFGLFRAVSQTAAANTEWVLTRMRQMIAATRAEPMFTDREIREAKTAILRSLVFEYETPFAQVKEAARFRFWGYPPDYIEIFQKGIAGVTGEDLRDAASRYLHPEGLKGVVVTDPATASRLKTVLEGQAGWGKIQEVKVP